LRATAGASRPWTVVALCFLVAALEGYDIQSFGVAAPRLVAEFGLSASAIGFAGGTAMIGLMIGAWLGGALAERFGTKAVLIGATAAFGACSLATAFSQSLEQLMLFRLMTGIGFGGVMPNLLSIATRLKLGTPLPWRTLFVIGGVMPLIIAPALVLALPRFDPPVASERHSLAAILFGEGRWARTLALWIAFGFALLLLYLLLNWLPLLVIGKGLAETVGASAAMAFNIGGIIGALLLGQSADRAGYALPLAVGAGLMVAGLVTMLTAIQVPLLMLASGLLGGGVVGMQYLLYAGATRPYPVARSIAAAGAAIGVGRLGSIAGPVLVGVARDAGLSVHALLLMMIPVAIAVAVFGIFATRGRAAASSPLA
jgi:AAHS family 3-hydroxyphenylpropionic acid transporter